MTPLQALQTTLAAEHAAVYVYGALGAQTSESAQPRLFALLQDAYAVHRGRRDHLVGRIRDLGGRPAAAAPAYELPARLDTPAAVNARARRLEADCATTYGFLVGSVRGEIRRWAITALTDAAVRGLAFGAQPDPLPGS